MSESFNLFVRLTPRIVRFRNVGVRCRHCWFA